MITILPGDIGFVRGGSLLGRIIRWFEREPGEEPTWPNHVLTFVSTGSIMTARVIEAQWQVQHVKWWDSVPAGTEIQVWRHKFQTGSEVAREIGWLNTQVGHRYGWWKLLAIAAKRLTGIPFDKALFIVDRPICSVLTAYGKFVGNVHFDRRALECTPDSMHDFVKPNANWQFVGQFTKEDARVGIFEGRRLRDLAGSALAVFS